MTMATKRREKTEQTSHKVIEKRRRDRINNCLAELSQTVPAAFAKQSSGKLEKAEILEMTVEYLRAIQATEIGIRFENGEWFSADVWADFMHHYQAGYSECMQEVIRYMTDVEGIDTNDSRCVRIVSYLQTRFRPDASINTGTVYREALNRVASQATRVTYGSGVPCNGSVRGLHRYSPYVPQSHSAYLNIPSPGVTPSTSCTERIPSSGSLLFGRNHSGGGGVFSVQSPHKPLATTALSNNTNIPGYLFTNSADVVSASAKVTGAISDAHSHSAAIGKLRVRPVALSSKI